MSELADIIAGNIERFDALREVYFPDGATVQLVKPSAATNDYDEVLEIATGWLFDTKKLILQIAVAESEIADVQEALDRASGFLLLGEFYNFTDTLTKPIGASPSWQIRCEAKGFIGISKNNYGQRF